VPFVLDF